MAAAFPKICHCSSYSFTAPKKTKGFTLLHSVVLNVASYFHLWDQVSFTCPLFWPILDPSLKEGRHTSQCVYLKGWNSFFYLYLPFQQVGRNIGTDCRSHLNCFHIRLESAPSFVRQSPQMGGITGSGGHRRFIKNKGQQIIH